MEIEKMTDWSNSAEARKAIEAGKLPEGFRMEEGILVVPAGARIPSTVMASHDEIRTDDNKTLKSRLSDDW